ncbi:MAG TPA: multifunctional CCA tRNA nucleotidyl transferase/2'3'-cyclic phosphodiesterase/2'nucleotidase/phosphatase [Pseudomonadales bacterium]|nr:multifunctional CCA tRNA nucleotidyl transferase/2'3'-cyclic phosphodiesterase/2'nucleotidase/phosphatase [Pseudomonadales bacterium]
MEIYLVGGAVRDALLGLPVRERDWVVVGSTPEDMLRLGYRQVGRDFPVFLHPQTNAEYALARTERKVGPGHTGFVCHAGPEVTLEQDLKRRDLTINAMAQADDGTLIDPWGGTADLAARRLRHVSEAFVEDPLRVFRVARFAAQLAAFDFRVEPGTAQLMSDMCRADVVAELAPERVWQEVSKALATTSPGRFFEVLLDCGGMTRWLAELAAVHGVVAFTNGRARKLSDPLDRFGALGWLLGAPEIETLADRLRSPNDHRRIALDVARHGRTLAGWRTVAAEGLLEAMKATGALRQPEWFARVVSVVAECASVDLSALVELSRRVAAVSSESFRNAGLEGQDLGKAIDVARTDLIRVLQAAS